MSFDKKLQSLRKAAGLNQEELANELGVSRQAVSKWESGVSYPEMDKLILMTRLFKCSLDDLVNDEVKNPVTSKTRQKKQESLLEFITKSISMFNSMKLSSVVKCFIEIIILIFLVAFFSAIIYAFLDSVLHSIFGEFLYPLYIFFKSVLFIAVFGLDFIIVFQFYKIRYLDYYDNLVYKYEVKNFKENEENAIKDVKSDDKKTEKAFVKDEKERIIIRDPNHKPLAFLSFLADAVLLIFKFFMRVVTVPFIFLLVLFVVVLVIFVYLVSYNTLFIGLSIACLAAIVFTVLVIRTLSNDLFKGTYPIKLMALLFLVTLIVGGMGIGFTIISFNKIDLKTEDVRNDEEKKYAYSDKLYLNMLGNNDNRIVFKVDEHLDDIVISYNYDARYLKYDLSNPAGDPNYLLLEKHYINQVNPKQEIDEFLNNIKNNVLVVYYYGYYHAGYHPSTIYPVVVRANEKHIRKLISNISEKEDIYTDIKKIDSDIYYYVYSFINNYDGDKICDVDDYYRKCINVVDKTRDGNFKYVYKSGKLLYDENKFVCELESSNYLCLDNDNLY